MSLIYAALFFLGFSLSGQEVEPVEIQLCDAWNHPERYAGQMVRFRAELDNIRYIMTLRDGNCGPIKYAYPADPDIKPKPSFTLIKDEAYNKVRSSLPVLLPDPETGKFGHLFVTVEGRFDTVFRLRKGKVVRVGKGFGHLGLWDNRLVLRQVLDVVVVKPE
jgi:hypothetical protein